MYLSGPTRLVRNGKIYIIKSISYDQTAMIGIIMELHCSGKIEADVTYGQGAMWKKLPDPELKFDIAPKVPEVIPADCRNLPVSSGSIKSIMYDPPFVAGHPESSKNSMIVRRGYGMFPGISELLQFYKDSIKEFWRILSPRGVLVFKCQDYVHDHLNNFIHCDILAIARAEGFKALDLFVLLAKTRIIRDNMKCQEHARKYHCYFWVFKKPHKRKPVLKTGP